MVPVVSSVPFLTAWLNVHSRMPDPDAYLWSTTAGQHPRYSTFAGMLARRAVRAGITKPVHPHLFRHSRATHLALHLTESQLKAHPGWVQASRMAAVYVHLSGGNVDHALPKLHGVRRVEPDRRPELLRPLTCARCRAANACTDRFCRACTVPPTASS